jgi:hypothetical protein
MTLTDRSLVSLAAVTPTMIMPANPSRQYVELQNNNSAAGNPIWASWTTSNVSISAQSCFQIVAQQYWRPETTVFVPTGALYAVSGGATNASSLLYAVES